MLLDHLQRQPSITPVEALAQYGCFRLAARVHELRQAGHDILTDMVHASNGKRYASYHLIRTARKKP
jgi:hypothetical protein